MATPFPSNFPPAPAVPGSWREAIAPRLPATLPPVTRAELADALAWFVGAATLEDRVDGLVALAGWLRAGGSPAVDPFSRGPDRIELLAAVLDAEPELSGAFRRAVAAVVAQPAGENPFGETGVPHRRGFLG